MLIKHIKKMATLSTQDPTGTTYQGRNIEATREGLRALFGKENGHEAETGHEWILETKVGEVFTLYCWNAPIDATDKELLTWHIGANSGYAGMMAKEEIEELLNK